MKKLRLIKNNKHVDLSGTSLEDLNYQKNKLELENNESEEVLFEKKFPIEFWRGSSGEISIRQQVQCCSEMKLAPAEDIPIQPIFER